MADVLVQVNSVAPSGLPFGSVFSWTNARVINTGTLIAVTNTDGSVTLISGTGFMLDGNGEPIGGTVEQITQQSAAGLSYYQSYSFTPASQPSLGDLRGQGVGDWLLSGQDIISDTGAANTAVLRGGAGNDVLTGVGQDTLIGGDGNDFYSVKNTSVKIVEALNVGSGYDIAEIFDNVASFTLSASVEELTHQGYAGALKGTGNALDNKLRGGIAADQLFGLDGHDDLNGWEGNDTVTGGKGNDTYHVEDAGDVVVEAAGQGIDKVYIRSSFNNLISFTMAANVENAEHEGGFIFGAIKITGNALNNQITGSGFGVGGDELIGAGGNDTLNGASNGAGFADKLAGGKGNDFYIDTEGDDTIIELAGQGIDTVQTNAASYTLKDHVENLVLLAGGTGFGNALANGMVLGTVGSLFGADGNDTLDSGTGFFSSFMSGGKGNDTYIVDTQFDAVNESSNAAGEGSADLTQSKAATLALQMFIENGAIIEGIKGQSRSLTGNAQNNSLKGSISDDTLDGEAGNDTLAGGNGNDTYVLDATGDKVAEVAGKDSGVDTAKLTGTAFASYTLGVNVENLELSSMKNGTGTGNALANKITGSAAGGDLLIGLGGNDELSGGMGDDTLKGGLGNDSYVLLSGFDDNDVFVELKNQGTDTIKTDLTALDLTNAKFANIENITGTGGVMHAFTGTAGKNVLTGDSNKDDMAGAGGDDQLFGLGDIDTLSAGDGNDTLDGGKGADNMFGGKGNDTYVVDDLNDNTFELAGEGTDTVRTALSAYTIAGGANFQVENLVYTGAGQFFGAGNDLANKITGGALADNLNGNEGADTLVGGKDDDTYIVDNLGDKIVELAKQGMDEIKIFEASGITSYTLAAANVENLYFVGTIGFTGKGNALGNALTGNAGNDSLFGLAGNDTLIGSTGTDTLTGGLGNDTYIVDNGNDKIVELAGQGTDTIIVTLGTYSLDDPDRLQVENLVFSAAGGSTLTGNALGNSISGAGDVDIINGGAGSDLLLGFGGGDVLIGGLGNDTLDGGDGPDDMMGGAGNDVYRVDNGGDVINEAAGGGTADKAEVKLSGGLWIMASELEIAAFTGIGSFVVAGNGSNNIITGGADGDSIDGGAGNDTMTGKGGNDTYVVDAMGDKVIEAANGGSDTVQTVLLAYTLGANVEFLELMGSAASKGTGNALDNALTGTGFDDTLTGLAGNDSFIGNGGKDTMIGGLGNDSYIVDSNDDKIVELAGQGNDEVRTALNVFTLADNVERLNFVGAGALTGTGNAGNNEINGGGGDDTLVGLGGNDSLKGNGGADTLTGGAGNDTLTGGAGADQFSFADNEGQDVVIDFQSSLYGGMDVLSLDGAIVNDFNDLVFSGAGQNVFQDENGTRIAVDPTTSILLLGFKATDLQMADII